MEFKNALKQYFKAFIDNKFHTSLEARITSAELVRGLFNLKKFDLRGTENLPSESGIIFIYNHISNNKSYILDNNFEITLDSHFISSVISNSYYQTPGIRVIRHSLPYEKAHNNYYNKFDYIRVYSKEYIPKELSEKKLKESKEEFYKASKLVLSKGGNLIVTPEGSSSTTAKSPTDFKAGVFKMIIHSKLDPLIVPLVMVNFDKYHSRTVYRCEIKKPFRLSEVIKNSSNRNQLSIFLNSLNKKYRKWVGDLRSVTSGYQNEINKLVKKKESAIYKKNLVVFYGSSTFRLWKNLNSDFAPYNVLNLGFGGAFIKDCLTYFDTLFSEINPAVIVLYVGGNDLSLGYSAEEINNLYKKLIRKIKIKFPNANILCVSIKPSQHRIAEIKKIKKLNHLIKNNLKKTEKAFYINIFKHFINSNGTIIYQYFLIDKLHLSQEGYNIWKNEIYSVIKKI